MLTKDVFLECGIAVIRQSCGCNTDGLVDHLPVLIPCIPELDLFRSDVAVLESNGGRAS